MVDLNEINCNRVGRGLPLPSRRHNLIHALIVSSGASRPLCTCAGWTRKCRGLESLGSGHTNTCLPSEHPHRVTRYTQRVCGHVPSPVRVRESTTRSHFIFLIYSPLPFLPKTPASWRGQENWREGSSKCESKGPCLLQLAFGCDLSHDNEVSFSLVER